MLPWLGPLQARLLEQAVTGQLHHALLIAGMPGLGKQSLAEAVARRLLCQQPQDKEACGHCPACQWFDSGAHPDLLRVMREEGKQTLPVDRIRALIDFLQQTAGAGRGKVALIHDAHAMNRNAANALLKILEEPPPDTWLLLLTDRPGGLPATVLSRCQRWTVAAPDRDFAVAWLVEQGVPTARAPVWLELAGGAPVRALEEGEALDDLLDRVREDWAALMARRDDPLAVADRWCRSGASDCLRLLWLLLAARLRRDAGQVSSLDIPESPSVSPMALVDSVTEVQEAWSRLQGQSNLNPMLLVESLLIACGTRLAVE